MKSDILKVLLIIVTIVAIILNFNSGLQGSYPSLTNFITTILYLGIWCSVFLYALKFKRKDLIIFSIIFWCIVLLTCLAAIYIIISDATSGLILLFSMVFEIPLYGIMIFRSNYNIFERIIIIVISSFFIIFGTKNLVKNNFSQTKYSSKETEISDQSNEGK